jgi:flagellar biogenesis protein FliO
MDRRSFVLVAVLIAAQATLVAAQQPYAPAAPGTFPADAAATPLTGVQQPSDVRQTSVEQPLPLAPPARANTPLQLPAAPGADAARNKTTGAAGFGTMLAALGVVLGLFLGAVALLRRGMPKPAPTLPKEAVEVLGRIPLPGRCQGHLIRVGNKIALVGFQGGHGEPLVEITDPLEVDRLAGLCRQEDPYSATTSFRGIVDQFFKEKMPGARDAAAATEVDDV